MRLFGCGGLRTVAAVFHSAWCAFWCAFVQGAGEVFFPHLEVMGLGDFLGVPDPLADDLNGERVCQFRLTGRAKILEDTGPRRKACSRDQLLELSAQVGLVAPVLGDDVPLALDC
ncbi:MAG TPA: hypothetical protein VF595_10590 [Tepidisphaeraceae bacterium]